MEERLPDRQVVLLGVGHTNAHVVKQWGMKAPRGVGLTCISHDAVATYSGMLPAVLAQQTPEADMQIDLVRLCESVGARLIVDDVAGIDFNQRTISFNERPDVAFDVLSIGIGSVPSMAGTEVSGNRLLTIKPMQTFLQRLSDAVDAALVDRDGQPLRIAVVGSGVAGVEITFCLPGFLKTKTLGEYSLNLVTRSQEVLPSVIPSLRAKALAELQQRGVDVVTRASVVEVNNDGLRLNNGVEIAADIVIWATGASPPPLVAQLNLPKDDRGFLATDDTLRSTSRQPVFAVGDTGTITSRGLPKAGVYAVRQGPVLWKNIQRLLKDEPLERYVPQTSFLKLVNSGDGSAMGEYKGVSFAGGWVRGLKNRIDSKFMRMYQVSDAMMAKMEVMPCRGCGCKLGGEQLSAGLSMADGEFEDAAEVSLQNGTVLASTDFFTGPFRDAWLNGRIAAIHSASDLVASGASVNAALANFVLPEGDSAIQQRLFSDITAGATREFEAMGGRIVGGHTITGPRLEIGFTVLGEPLQDGRGLRKTGLNEGDALVVTKPLGIGVLLAAHMRSMCAASDFETLLATMLDAQAGVSRIAVDMGLTSCTDITGFGLLGHLVEMLEASEAWATIDLAAVPLLPGTARCLGLGVESTLAPSNRCNEKHVTIDDRLRDVPQFAALFDPQTCGGLLLGVPAQSLAAFQSRVQDECGATCHVIGEVVSRRERRITVDSSEI